MPNKDGTNELVSITIPFGVQAHSKGHLGPCPAQPLRGLEL